MAESGDRHTGRRSLCSTDPDWSTGEEMSRVLRLLRSWRPFFVKEPVLLLPFSFKDGVRFTFEISLENVDFPESSLPSLELSSM